MSVTDHDMGFGRILRELTSLENGAGVYVGIRQKKGSKPAGVRSADGSVKDDSKTTIADIATWNEFGAEIRTGPRAGTKIPERSFLRATVDANGDRYTQLLATQLGAVVDGKQTPEGGLKILGAAAVRDVQVRIRGGISPANAPSTIEAKGSSVPLIDTGRLRQSIDYQVVMGTTPAGEAPLPAETASKPRQLHGAAKAAHEGKLKRLAGGV
jgi:hypothetical protein